MKWFGAESPIGFTSRRHHWTHEVGDPITADDHLMRLMDVRLPLTLTDEEADHLGAILCHGLVRGDWKPLRCRTHPGPASIQRRWSSTRRQPPSTLTIAALANHTASSASNPTTIDPVQSEACHHTHRSDRRTGGVVR